MKFTVYLTISAIALLAVAGLGYYWGNFHWLTSVSLASISILISIFTLWNPTNKKVEDPMEAKRRLNGAMFEHRQAIKTYREQRDHIAMDTNPDECDDDDDSTDDMPEIDSISQEFIHAPMPLVPTEEVVSTKTVRYVHMDIGASPALSEGFNSSSNSFDSSDSSSGGGGGGGGGSDSSSGGGD